MKLSSLIRRARRALGMRAKPHPLIDIFNQYGFADLPPIVLRKARAPGGITLNWYMPDFGVGSGGHTNIFRFIYYLEKLGFRNRIIIIGPTARTDPVATRKEIHRHFLPVKAPVLLGVAEVTDATFHIATNWNSAYFVRAVETDRRKLYFVQDFEPYFHIRGTDYALAEDTYKFGFFGITGGAWLAKKLAREYGMKTVPFDFAIDPEIYQPRPRRPKERKEARKKARKVVFFYARPPTPRRAFELGLFALAELHRRRPDLDFILAGWDVSGFKNSVSLRKRRRGDAGAASIFLSSIRRCPGARLHQYIVPAA